LGCDDEVFSPQQPTNFGAYPPSASPINFDGQERWVNRAALPSRFSELRANKRINVLLNATVVAIDTDASSQVIKGLMIAREGHQELFSGATVFVLAMGGVETSRLLLNARANQPALFGGPKGALGKFYMGHISGSIASIQFYDPKFASRFAEQPGLTSFGRRRITMKKETQIAHRLPNIAFWPDNLELADPRHGSGILSAIWLLLNAPVVGKAFVAEAVRQAHVRKTDKLWSHYVNLFRDIEGTSQGVANILWQKFRYGRSVPRLFIVNGKGSYPLHFHAEQIPRIENSVRLTAERDWLGLRRVEIDFGFSSGELGDIVRAHRLLDGTLRRMGVGELVFGATEDAAESYCRRKVIPDGLHQIGITRMSDDAAKGVADADGRLFEFQNLFIAGSSLFPTSGQANPTYPAVALAVRLAEHIAAKCIPSRVRKDESATLQRESFRRVGKRMKILMVTASYYPAVRYGGPTYTVHSLAKHLVLRGHEVAVYTTNVDGNERLKVGSNVLDGVQVHYFQAVSAKLYWSPTMIRALRANAARFDIVHAQGAFIYTSVAARRVAERLNIPFVYSPRGMLVAELIRRKNRLIKRSWVSTFERHNCAVASTIHATSDIERDEIYDLGLRTKRIDVIPNGVDAALQEDSSIIAERRIRLTGGTWPYVLVLGRVNWKKGIDRLIRAMSFVPDIRLVVAGNDEENYTPQLHKVVEEEGITDRVVFVGPAFGADKIALMRGAELFVLPSYSESFGVVVLEAMACGCPVIVTPEVGLANRVQEVGAGICVEGTPHLLSSAINSLLNDRVRRNEMGKKGIKAAAELFSWESIAGQMEMTYRRCVEKNE
jgi:glycosyltransferase involved in cell wall biosynthesis